MKRKPVFTHEEFDALWNVRDVATYLKASRSWVYQKAESGELPSLRICGLLRFDPNTIRDWARGKSTAAAVISLPSSHTPVRR